MIEKAFLCIHDWPLLSGHKVTSSLPGCKTALCAKKKAYTGQERTGMYSVFVRVPGYGHNSLALKRDEIRSQ